MQLKERIDDIEDTILQVATHMGVPMTQLERMSMARRLAKYHGPELFRILLALHEGKFFPTGSELEHRVRKAMGMDPAKGMSEELVERNRKELVAQGQAPEKAAAGADLMKRAMRLPAQDPVAGTVSLTPAQAATQTAHAAKGAAIVAAAFEELPTFDPLSLLEDFDAPAEIPAVDDLLASLEEF